jgi:hypothetical protein
MSTGPNGYPYQYYYYRDEILDLIVTAPVEEFRHMRLT